ncbi:hypothetical protein VTK73DRAFT_5738 [Phialemonium thermophilum]|uniref:Uncharacterized protein n=1 Tax=Phialemonium thermophilum TaxID=223376 RepID=A0ABR3WLZ2_9PEZI
MYILIPGSSKRMSAGTTIVQFVAQGSANGILEASVYCYYITVAHRRCQDVPCIPVSLASPRISYLIASYSRLLSWDTSLKSHPGETTVLLRQAPQMTSPRCR